MNPMDILAVSVIVGIAASIIIPLVAKARKERKRQENLLRKLFALKGGVWIRQPNGGATGVQTDVQQALCENGMEIFNLKNAQVEKLIQSGLWDNTITGQRMDVVVVGQLITKKSTCIERVYPTRQHIHTASGQYFHQLPIENGGRPVNCGCEDSSFPAYACSPRPSSTLRTASPLPNHYHESEAEFKARREREAVEKRVEVTYYVLDVTFYGPDGTIRGGYAGEHDSTDVLVKETVLRLAEAVTRSKAGHERRLAEQELRALPGE